MVCFPKEYQTTKYSVMCVALLACSFSFHGLFMIKHEFLDGALEMQLFLLTALLLFSPFVCNVENIQ